MQEHKFVAVLIMAAMKIFHASSSSSGISLKPFNPSLEDLGYSTMQARKKSLDLEVPEAEHVCPTTIMRRHTPNFGHMGNGSFVEIQQDFEQNFKATYVECTNGHHRPPCHGIDTTLFGYSSECVTAYEWRFAYVRLPGSRANFVRAQIKNEDGADHMTTRRNERDVRACVWRYSVTYRRKWVKSRYNVDITRSHPHSLY